MSEYKVILDGQSIERWHSEEGQAARLKGIRMAEKLQACWPPCGAEHCQPIRDYMASSEYTGEP